MGIFVGFRGDEYGLDAKLAACAVYSQRDLATICN
jgi:hypothetical protein